MPWTPTGITVSFGLTSLLNRLRSIPRYPGASRRRINRGNSIVEAILTAYLLPPVVEA